MDRLTAILLLIFIFLIYFIPSAIAFRKGHRNKWSIFWLNLLLGGSGAGWIVCLVWAIKK
jgi:hypothetical protein